MNKDKQAPVSPYIAILFAILFISSASIIIRFSSAPPVVLAFYRVFLASLLLFVLRPKRILFEWRSLDKKTLIIIAWSGLFLALHFAFWISSLGKTTVANAVTLVDSAPAFTMLVGYVVFKEKVSRNAFIGVVLTMIGVILLTASDFSLESEYFLGDILALLGAVTMAMYLICGRIVRKQLEFTSFLVLVYGFAALFLSMWVILSGYSFIDYVPKEFIIFAGLAIIPTIGGHSLFLYALRYMKAYQINAGFLGEPVGATLLAFWILNETPNSSFYLFGALIMVGILLATMSHRSD